MLICVTNAYFKASAFATTNRPRLQRGCPIFAFATQQTKILLLDYCKSQYESLLTISVCYANAQDMQLHATAGGSYSNLFIQLGYKDPQYIFSQGDH